MDFKSIENMVPFFVVFLKAVNVKPSKTGPALRGYVGVATPPLEPVSVGKLATSVGNLMKLP